LLVGAVESLQRATGEALAMLPNLGDSPPNAALFWD
jgi:hypothetical protein